MLVSVPTDIGVAPPFQGIREVRGQDAVADSIVDVQLQKGSVGRLALLLGHIGHVGGVPVLGLLNDRQAMLTAQFICGGSHDRIVVGGWTAELLAVLEAHAVDDVVGVEMVVIPMAGHQHLESVSPQPLGQLHAEGVALFRRDLPRLKAHIAVIGNDPAGLAVAAFGLGHALVGQLGQAVHTADEVALLGLGWILGVIHELAQIVCVGILGLVGVRGIIQHILDRVVNRPNGCDRHHAPPW